MTSVQHQPSIRPLLVTGMPRSGTTWVGRMFAESNAYRYLYEPFNPDNGSGRDIRNIEFDHYFTYISEHNSARYAPALREMFAGEYQWWQGLMRVARGAEIHRVLADVRSSISQRSRGIPVLLKDPIALLSAEWLAREFNMDVVVMYRNPHAFVSSMKRWNWGFAPKKWALSQPELMRDHLERFRPELEELDRTGGDAISQGGLVWKIFASVIMEYKTRNPSWAFVSHEQVSLDPVRWFRNQYEQFGLHFDNNAKEAIISSSNANEIETSTVNSIALNSRLNLENWRSRLSIDEVQRIDEIVKPYDQALYPPVFA